LYQNNARTLISKLNADHESLQLTNAFGRGFSSSCFHLWG
jgi:hypothetical protein